MPDPSRKTVRHFRQILIWPLQLQPIRKGQIQEPWELLMQPAPDNPWTPSRDRFGRGQARRRRRRAVKKSGWKIQKDLNFRRPAILIVNGILCTFS